MEELSSDEDEEEETSKTTSQHAYNPPSLSSTMPAKNKYHRAPKQDSELNEFIKVEQMSQNYSQEEINKEKIKQVQMIKERFGFTQTQPRTEENLSGTGSFQQPPSSMKSTYQRMI